MPLQQLTANHIGAQGGGYEITRTNGFLVFFVGMESLGNAGDLLTLNVQTMSMPKDTTAIIEVPFANEVRKFPGRTTYDDLQITFTDYIDRSAAGVLEAWRGQCRNLETGGIGRAATLKKRVRIEQGATDALPNSPFREWELVGAWLSQFDRGEGDYGTDDFLRITCTLTYDKLLPGRGVRLNAA